MKAGQSRGLHIVTEVVCYYSGMKPMIFWCRVPVNNLLQHCDLCTTKEIHSVLLMTMVYEVEKRYGAKELHALSLHPGGIVTNLQQYLDPESIKRGMENKSSLQYMSSAEQGAATTVYAAISKEWEGRGGRYLANLIEQDPAGAKTPPFDTWDQGYAPGLLTRRRLQSYGIYRLNLLVSRAVIEGVLLLSCLIKPRPELITEE